MDCGDKWMLLLLWRRVIAAGAVVWHTALHTVGSQCTVSRYYCWPDLLFFFLQNLSCESINPYVRVGIVLYSTPLFALVLLPVGAVYVFIGTFYRYGERDLKRILQVCMCVCVCVCVRVCVCVCVFVCARLLCINQC